MSACVRACVRVCECAAVPSGTDQTTPAGNPSDNRVKARGEES